MDTVGIKLQVPSALGKSWREAKFTKVGILLSFVGRR